MTCSSCGMPLTTHTGTGAGTCGRCLASVLLDELGAPGPGPATATPAPPGAAARPWFPTLGSYEILEEIARGGMGVVYRARQPGLEREVALKVLLAGPFADQQSVARLQVEATSAARLQHPGIVAIHEIGQAAGHHFISMEFVRGRTLAEKTRGGPLPPTEAARYVAQVAQAVHYAHGQGVYHRDLKPSNILVGADDRPRVTDFGLAKLAGHDDALTLTGQALGTPSFAAPEQLAPRLGEVTPRSDVYGLGALLYHLLVGKPPFLANSVSETIQQVVHSEPVPPRSANRSVPRDLDTLVLRCLGKEPGRRYSTAGEVAEELSRWLEGRPILAQPISPAGRLARWARRKPALATLATALLLAVGLGLAGVLWQGRRAQEEATRANAAVRDTRNALVHRLVASGNDLAGRGRSIEALPWFLAAWQNEPDAAHLEAHRMRLETALGMAPRSEHLWAHSNEVTTLTLARAQEWVATGSADRQARVWSLATGEPVTGWLPHRETVRGLEFAHQDSLLLSYSSQRHHHPGLGPEQGSGSVRLWSVPGGREVWSATHTNTIGRATWSPDGTRIASACSDGWARVWRVHPGPDGVRVELEHAFPHPAEVRSATFSPDSAHLATGARDGTNRVWELSSGRLRMALPGVTTEASWRHWERRWEVAFRPDGRQLLAYHDFGARAWELPSGRPQFDLLFEGEANVLRYSPDSRLLASADRTGRVEVWIATNGVRQTALNTREYQSSVEPDLRVDFSPDSTTLLVWNRDAFRFHSPLSGLPWSPHPPTRGVRCAALTEDGRRLVLGTESGLVWVWDKVHPATTGHILDLPYTGGRVAFSPDGRRLVSADLMSNLTFWDPLTGRSLLPESRIQRAAPWGIRTLQVSPDGRLLLACDSGGTARVYDFRTGAPVSALWTNTPDRNVTGAFLEDGRSVVTGDAVGILRIWRIADGQCLRSVTNAPGLPITRLLLGPRGAALFELSNDGRGRRRDSRTLEQRGEPMDLGGPAGGGALSPDGRLLVSTCSSEGMPRVWDASTGALLHVLDHPVGPTDARFSPDGRTLATFGDYGGIRFWDPIDGRLRRSLRVEGTVASLEFSQDGRWVAAGGSRGSRVYDVDSGQALTPMLEIDTGSAWANDVRLSPDGAWLAASGSAAKTRLWPLAEGHPGLGPHEWEPLVAALAGTLVNAAGEPIEVTGPRLQAFRREAIARFPEEFRPGPTRLARFMWDRAKFLGTPAGWRQALPHLDRAVAVDPPDSPSTGFSQFRHMRSVARLFTDDFAGAVEDKPSLALPPRDRACTPHQIDLGPFYNRGIGAWGLGMYGQYFGGLTPGRQSLGGIVFDVRGALFLDGDHPNRGRSRAQSGIVPVDSRGAKVHVLLATDFEDEDGAPVGDVVLHYADDSLEHLPMLYGRDARNWWTVQGEPAGTPNARVVWRGWSPAAAWNGETLRLHLRTYDNPRPGASVKSLEVVSAMKRAAPIVLAITLE